ncbi:MAG: riboflavin synthase [Verrucomicrobia bacterium Tous-C9LFEB]|nr:MAG: riboflavin synthase [Verrucomicrobia bacterium Tous-C9LFEB]
MFSGIIEGTGSVIQREPTEQSVRFVIDAGVIAQGIKLGDSVANNGCCLTVVDIQGSLLSFDLLNETLECTNLKHLQPGSIVNLERSLCVGDRIGGHFVTGHIDCTGRVLRFDQIGKDYEIEVMIDPRQAIYLVPKGSIAIDGISLTVGKVTKTSFTVWIIPHTRDVTNLHTRTPGSEVNLEFDMLAKYTEKILTGQRQN